MRAFVEKMMIIALFLVCACGQAAFAAPQGEVDNAIGSAESVAEKAPADPAIRTAQDTRTDPAVPAKNVQDMRDIEMPFPVFRTLGAMALVICLMIGIYLAAKKFAPRYFSRVVAERNMKIIESLSMGDRRSIAVIEVGNSRFLVGNTPQQINLLAPLPEPKVLVSEPEPEPVHPREKDKNESGSPFRSLFEVAKSRSPHYRGNPLPEDIRAKMRQLRDALER